MAIGETLRNAREALGLSQKDVAESTHMLTQMVHEIEEEDYHRFTAPVYGKGFIKLFAKAVGLDPAPLVAEFLANPTGNAEQKKSKKTAPLVEKILTEPGDDSQADSSGDEPESSETTPPPPPRHTYAKASTVTLPRADSPFAVNTQNPPPPRQPVSSTPSKLDPIKPKPPLTSPTRLSSATALESGEIVKPRSTADDVHNASTFKLEADSVAVPPQPVAQLREPFTFPGAPKRPIRNEAEEKPERPVQAKRPPRPRRDDEPKRPSIVDVLNHLAALAANTLKAIRVKLDSMSAAEDDEESKIRKRYILTGFLVFATVVAVIVIAASSSSSDSHKDIKPPLVAANEVVEPIVEEPVLSTTTEPLPIAVPAVPVVIARVLPPPKMFAK